MEIWHIPVVFTVGIIAGFINTIAGGGSLLTLPILIFLGLPTAVANGTNRLAIMTQCLFAVIGFKRKGVSNFKLSLLLSVPALIGAIIGAQIAVDLSDILFKRVLAIIMLLVLGLILWNPRQNVGRLMSSGLNHFIITMIAFFFIGNLPLVLMVALSVLSAIVTGKSYIEAGRSLSVAVQWFFIMLPFSALLSFFVIFFFNFAAESHVLLQRKWKQVNEEKGGR